MKYHRSDLNQSDIVSDLRKCGYSVLVLSPYCSVDLLVGAPTGRMYCFEVKQEGIELRKSQQEFIDNFKGNIYKISSAEEAIEIMENHV